MLQCRKLNLKLLTVGICSAWKHLNFARGLFLYEQSICLSLMLSHESWFFSLLGRKIAIDASMSIYQFLIAVRSDGSQLTNELGETTRYAFPHIFSLSIRLHLMKCE